MGHGEHVRAGRVLLQRGQEGAQALDLFKEGLALRRRPIQPPIGSGSGQSPLFARTARASAAVRA